MNDKIVLKIDSNGGSSTRTMELPGNSKKNKVEEPKPPRVKKVIVKDVKRVKRPITTRIFQAFLGEEVEDVKHYMVHDVFIPAMKNLLWDSITGGLGMRLYGEARGHRTSRDKGTSHVSYSNYYKGGQQQQRRQAPSNRNSGRHKFDDIPFATRGDAEEVLSALVDLTIDYDGATVRDFYDLVGMETSMMDEKYGWTDLSSAKIVGTRNGYIIQLPRTEQLN